MTDEIFSQASFMTHAVVLWVLFFREAYTMEKIAIFKFISSFGGFYSCRGG